MNRLTLLLLIALLALTGCPNHSAHRSVTDADTLYRPRFSERFTLQRLDNSTLATVHNPWQGASNISMQWFLRRANDSVPTGFQGTVIDVPLRRVAVMSSGYVAFLDALGKTSTIVGVSGSKFISNPQVQRRVASGAIEDVGYDRNLNYEKLTAMRPDAVFVYGLQGGHSPEVQKMEELGLNVIYIGDYLENNPLGKAEWLVFFGELFDCRPQAETLFNDICTRYERVRALVSDSLQRPSVMFNSPWNDKWFLPGDRSYMIRLLRDAGARYVAEGYDSDQSRAVASEEAYVYCSKADFWLNPSMADKLDELKAQNPKFQSLPAVQNGRVYNNNARQTAFGGSDFWESAIVRPEVVLQDMIRIFHPELLPDYTLYYFKPLK